MTRAINPRFFEQPGFDVLYGTWSEVLEQDANGTYVLSPEQAIEVLRHARHAALAEGIRPSDATALESVACRYAQEIKFSVNEVAHG